MNPRSNETQVNRRLLCGALVFAVAALATAAWAQSAVARLGYSDTEAQSRVMTAMEGSGYGSSVAAKMFLAMPPAARVATVNQVIAWTKMYIASPMFKQEWAKKRDASKPRPPADQGSTDQVVSQNNAAMQKQIDQMRQAAANLPPDQRKVIEDTIKQITAQQQAAAKDPQQQSFQRQAIEANRASDQKRYQDDLKKWQEDFPADPAPVIARRLREFLTMSADVNFDAKLVDRDGRKIFADPQYEKKSSGWKICFRAGRDATTAARAAAQSWLKDLPAPSNP